MTASHTPGPWTRIAGERFKHDSSAGVTEPGGNYIAAALDRNRYDLDEEVEANARLIAAAPDLLDACTGFAWLGNNLHNIIEDPAHFRQLFEAALDDARAAIAKARGES